MNLPILGTLFRSRDYQRQETELIVIVTPETALPRTGPIQGPVMPRPFLDAPAEVSKPKP